MRILLLGKVPPIQGGVSRMTLATMLELVRQGHEVTAVTNAAEVESNFRQTFLDEDHSYLESIVGGKLRIRNLAPFVGVPECIHIPFSSAFESRLLGNALDVIENWRPDVIMGWYFQPYGVVASILSGMTGIPYGIVHAGSDIGRLRHQPDLKAVHRRMVAGASFLFTGADRIGRDQLVSLGADPECIHTVRVENEMDASPPHVDLSRYSLARPQADLDPRVYGDDEIAFLASTRKELDPGTPLLTMYGKLGRAKGQVAFVETLAKLSNEGHRFQFALNYAGSRVVMRQIRDILESNTALRSKAFLLPMIPTWRIKSLLEASSAVAFLENGFDVRHTPGIPFEIIGARKPLILSQDIARSSPFSSLLEMGVSALDGGVPGRDEALHQSLECVLRAPDTVRLIGQKGGVASDVWKELSSRPSHRPTMARFFHELETKLKARQGPSPRHRENSFSTVATPPPA